MTVIQEQYFSALVLFALGAGLVVVFVILNTLLAPQRRFKKDTSVQHLSAFVSYECGEVPVGEAHTRFNFQYYVFALVFVIFDVITAFLFPWAIVLKNQEDQAGNIIFNGLGAGGMLAVGIFLGVFLIGFGYWWKRDALRWM